MQLSERSDHSPPTDLFDAATRYDALWLAWEKVRANSGAMGGDGISVQMFAADAATRVSRLSHALRTGSYRPRDSRRVDVPKRTGGTRTLLIPSVVDRVAQASVALVIGPQLDKLMEPASFAYRPGRSVADAIARIATLRREGYVHVVEGDIVRYFDNIRHEPLIDLLDRHLGTPRLVDLIALWLEDAAPHGLGVAQGSPLSPLLANLYLDAIDERIDGRGIRLVRYADDFVILCKDSALARSALAQIAAMLSEAGLQLHPDKTRVVDFERGFRFLGHLMVKSMVFKEVSLDETPAEDLVTAAEAALILATSGVVSQPGVDEATGVGTSGRWSVRRRVLYVLEPGRGLEADGVHFVVREGEQTLLDLPAARVDRIEIGPEVTAHIAAFDLAATSGTEIVRINGRGETLGRWSGNETGRARRQLRQAAALLDEGRRAVLARAFVAGKVNNQRMLIKRIDRRRRNPDADIVSVKLARIYRKVALTPLTVAEAMGHEGDAARLYWPMLEKLLELPWAFAGQRKRRVGFDPFNVVLDVLSSLLLRECRAAVTRAGLHPGYAFLHSPDDDSEPLSFDLAEEFRAPLVEAVAMALFKRRALTESSFMDTANGVRLTRTGWAAVIRGFEGQMARPIRDRIDGVDRLWRGMVDTQGYRLAEAIEDNTAYIPYSMDY